MYRRTTLPSCTATVATPGYSTGTVVTASVVSFGVGVAVEAAMHNSSCGYGYWGWGMSWGVQTISCGGRYYYGDPYWRGGYYPGYYPGYRPPYYPPPRPPYPGYRPPYYPATAPVHRIREIGLRGIGLKPMPLPAPGRPTTMPVTAPRPVPGTPPEAQHQGTSRLSETNCTRDHRNISTRMPFPVQEEAARKVRAEIGV